MDAHHLHVSGTAPVHAAVQGREIHGGVHIHAPTTAPAEVPRQLPRPSPRFTNRDEEMGLLDRELTRAIERADGGVVVLTGAGGVGKSALAVAFLSSVQAHFAAGTLFADLAGFTPDVPPADPAAVLDGFLRALGLAAEQIPAAFDSRAALFRSLTHQRPVAVLLDNAATTAQVRALLPGPGPHLVVVTTRMHLAGLLTEGARFLPVADLEPEEAAALLGRLVADVMPVPDRAATAELAGLCGGLPLAVCALAGRLTLRPNQPFRRVAAELRASGRRLHTLSRGAEMPLDAVFDASYTVLQDEAARLYRLLGLHPGPHFDAAASAALADLTSEDAEDLLADLARASLLQPHTVVGRYRLHDLIAAHARQRLDHDEEPAARTAALERLLDYYLRTATAADVVLNPGRWRLAPLVEQARGDATAFEDRAAALAWLEDEAEVLARCVRLAHEQGYHRHAWQLCEALGMLLILRKPYETWRATHELGLASAQASGDDAAAALLHLRLGLLELNLQQPDAAHEHFTRAQDGFRRVGHRLGQASAQEGLGTCALTRHHPHAAVGHFEAALAIHTHLKRPRGIALMHRYLGQAHHGAGNHATALTHYRHALEYFTAAAEPYHHAQTLLALARTHLAAGQAAHTRTHAQRALDLAHASGATHQAATAHTLLAHAARDSGDIPTARHHLTQAHTTYTQLGSPQATHTRHLLDDLHDSPD